MNIVLYVLRKVASFALFNRVPFLIEHKITRKNIHTLIPYCSARSENTVGDAILLDANENPFNKPFNRYPDPMQTDVKSRIAGQLGISDRQLFLGNGSDEAIDLLFRAFCEPGRENALGMDPSYGMYEVCAQINDIRYSLLSLDGQFQPDTEKILQAVDGDTRLIFFCSPNNPSGNLLDEERIIRIIRQFDGLVIIDEAYVDFSGSEGWISRINDFPNLVLLRTFSKAWGLAGVRLGMAVADEKIIGILNKIKYPYNINMLSLEKVNEMLDEAGKKGSWVKEIREERKRMEKELPALRSVQRVFPSDANFLLVRFHNAERILNYLKEKRIIVRDRSRMHQCTDCLRITIGTVQENDLLIRTLSDYEKL